MSTDPILASWQANAGNWIKTVDDNEIESRRLVTNQAIVDCIVQYKPNSILDIGCGEGWLTRTLQAHGIAAFGIDAVEDLVTNARQKGGEHYATYSYQQLTDGAYTGLADFDAVVFNFSLLDKDDTDQLLHYMGTTLHSNSLLFIQTLHPYTLLTNGGYTTGWKDGSWNGLKQDFVQPYQWYGRTMTAWVQLFADAGLHLQQLLEPLHPATGSPASVIFVLKSCK